MSTTPTHPAHSERHDPQDEPVDEDAPSEELLDDLGLDPEAAGLDVHGHDPVNRALDAASNREARRREAEEDRGLVELARKGDRAAFRQLIERHQRRAFSIALGLVRDENDAREIVQEAFLRVHRGLETFQGSSSFFTWLYRIITNLSIDLMRKPGRRDVEFQDYHERDEDEEGAEIPFISRLDGADPINVMRRREIIERLQAALDELPPYHRGVILMREVEGMSYDEMAEAMGVSKGTIMSRLFHARQKLQRALADCYAEEMPGERRGNRRMSHEQ